MEFGSIESATVSLTVALSVTDALPVCASTLAGKNNNTAINHLAGLKGQLLN
jgi:hypothetical protein